MLIRRARMVIGVLVSLTAKYRSSVCTTVDRAETGASISYVILVFWHLLPVEGNRKDQDIVSKILEPKALCWYVRDVPVALLHFVFAEVEPLPPPLKNLEEKSVRGSERGPQASRRPVVIEKHSFPWWRLFSSHRWEKHWARAIDIFQVVDEITYTPK